MRKLLAIILSLLILSSCAVQKKYQAEYIQQEARFNTAYLKSIHFFVKFQQTGDSAFHHQADIYLTEAVHAYLNQKEVNKKLRKPYPDYGITNKAKSLADEVINEYMKTTKEDKQ